MSLELMLKELRLTAFSQHLADYQRQASDQTWSYADFLSKLCEQELARLSRVNYLVLFATITMAG